MVTTENNTALNMSTSGKATSDGAAELPLVEIGWLVAGRLDAADWQATQQAQQSVIAVLESTFPQFRWRMPIVRRDELTTGPREEPAVLLEHGVDERNTKHWDFTVIVTGAQLIGHYGAESIAVVSRSLDSVVISTSQLDPRANDPNASQPQRTSAMTSWLRRLVLYTFGRLCGLAQTEDDETNLLFSPAELSDIDRPAEFTEEQRERLVKELAEIADRRLEETTAYQRANRFKFYFLSTWVNRREIVTAVREAKPWQFPFRLSRLTTAGLSAMVILMVTAEVWELAISQRGWFVTLLSLVAVIAATTYVILRQGLYIRRRKSRLTEQTVTTNVTTVLVVLLGMTTTYLLVFGTALLAGLLLFRGRLVNNWAGEGSHPPLLDEYCLLAAFVAALALFIGALGATFESNHYFRHITFVDEEV